MADPSSTFPEEIFCTEEEVLDLLLTVDTSKATGSDGISGRMLKSTAHSIAPDLTEMFNFIFMLSTLHFGTIILNSLLNGKSDYSFISAMA